MLHRDVASIAHFSSWPSLQSLTPARTGKIILCVCVCVCVWIESIGYAWQGFGDGMMRWHDINVAVMMMMICWRWKRKQCRMMTMSDDDDDGYALMLIGRWWWWCRSFSSHVAAITTAENWSRCRQEASAPHREPQSTQSAISKKGRFLSLSLSLYAEHIMLYWNVELIDT